MTAWNPAINLIEPAGLSDLVSGLGNLTSAANATLDAAGTALDAAKVFLSAAAAPEAAAAQALVTSAQNLISDIFGGGFFQVVVHPWTPGVGRLEGVWRHLSFPQATAALAASLDDAGDDARPQFSSAASVEMVALIAGAPSPSIFRSVLAALNALLDTREFALAMRRIDQAFALEAERFAAPVASRAPDWQSVTVRDMWPALAPLEDALNQNLAMLQGYADGAATAVDAAISLVAAKRAQLTNLQNQLNAAAALFGQGLANAGVYALHIDAAGGNDLMKSELRNATGAPGPELSFCAGVVWVGPGGSLNTLAGMLGV